MLNMTEGKYDYIRCAMLCYDLVRSFHQ